MATTKAGTGPGHVAGGVILGLVGVTTVQLAADSAVVVGSMTKGMSTGASVKVGPAAYAVGFGVPLAMGAAAWEMGGKEAGTISRGFVYGAAGILALTAITAGAAAAAGPAPSANGERRLSVGSDPIVQAGLRCL